VLTVGRAIPSQRDMADTIYELHPADAPARVHVPLRRERADKETSHVVRVGEAQVVHGQERGR
jgi:hypothetical protein